MQKVAADTNLLLHKLQRELSLEDTFLREKENVTWECHCLDKGLR